jgi:hypothetical protein
LVCTALFSDRRGESEREREREREAGRERETDREKGRQRSRDRQIETGKTDVEQISSFGSWSGESSGKSFAVSGGEEFFRQEEVRDITLTDKERQRQTDTNEIDRRRVGFDFCLKLVLFFVYPDGMPQTPSCIVVCLFVHFFFFFFPPLP